ncbi:MAG TPA: pyridoxamine 5'-phosphate oxidase [Isosphaeraceae bacterium]|jgi:pyridoxamine 5'-phosphate oxidase|nr:pyridoxamine 5'-phosphate oxidase [Isosphaeraceae bacterium]
MQLADLRREYALHGLSEGDVDPDPIRQFARWFEQAWKAALPEPNAMTLATATPDGRPSARIVLLKGFDELGFCFFTSYEGRKARELAVNPRAALVLYWAELERQVRIEGTVEPVTAAESDDYFRSRPMGSRLGAWASPQSEVIAGREALEERRAAAVARFADGDIPRPPSWGGYRLRPSSLEFWQGRPDRLHDRIRYRLDHAGSWLIERLAP